MRLQDFDAAQARAESAWEAVELSHGPTEARAAAAKLPGGLQAQHGVFAEALALLIESVTPRADDEFERNLIEAAAGVRWATTSRTFRRIYKAWHAR